MSLCFNNYIAKCAFLVQLKFLLPSSSLHLFPCFTLLYSNNDIQSALFQSNNPSHFYSTEYFGHCNITMATFEKMSDGSYIIKPIKQKQMVCCTLLVNFNSTEKPPVYIVLHKIIIIILFKDKTWSFA